MELSGVQPLYAFVELSIGGTTVSSFTDSVSDSVIDLMFERKSNQEYGSAGSKFTITLYDDSALDIEEIISSSLDSTDYTNSNVKINYGWANSSSSRISESSINGTVTEYSLSFEGASVLLTITGIISSLYEAKGTPKSAEYDAATYGGRASEVVRAICEEEGWDVGAIERTEPEPGDDGTPKTFVRNNQSAGEFISSLLEDAVSEEIEGSTGYNFFFGEDGKAYFVSEENTSYGKVNTKKKYPPGMPSDVYNNYYEGKDEENTPQIDAYYEFYSGQKNNTVISFTPEYSGKCVQSVVPGSSYAVDSIKNEMMACTMSSKHITDLGASHTIMGMSSSSYNKLKRKSESMWCKYGKWAYPATMEVMGDPTIKIFSNIYVAVYTKYGYLHHTSGIYLIKGAEDNISGGSFTTTLSLLKLGNNKKDMKSQSDAESFYSTLKGDATQSTTDSSSSSTYSNNSSMSTSEKAKEVTGGVGINRLSDTRSFCSSLVTDVTVTCRNENMQTYQKTLTVNKYLVDSVKAIFSDIYNNTMFCVRASDTAAFNYRPVNNGSNSKNLSYHSYGVAIDINSSSNPFNKNAGGSNSNIQIRDENHAVVQIFKKYGWGWGGTYGDLMHFSYFNGS